MRARVEEEENIEKYYIYTVEETLVIVDVVVVVNASAHARHN